MTSGNIVTAVVDNIDIVNGATFDLFNMNFIITEQCLKLYWLSWKYSNDVISFILVLKIERVTLKWFTRYT